MWDWLWSLQDDGSAQHAGNSNLLYLGSVPVSLPIDRPLRLAVVGAGQIGELVIPAYLDHPDIEIVGVCEGNPNACLAGPVPSPTRS